MLGRVNELMYISLAHSKYLISLTIIVITIQMYFPNGTINLAFNRPLFGSLRFFSVMSFVSIELKESAKLCLSIRLKISQYHQKLKKKFKYDNSRNFIFF